MLKGIFYLTKPATNLIKMYKISQRCARSLIKLSKNSSGSCIVVQINCTCISKGKIKIKTKPNQIYSITYHLLVAKASKKSNTTVIEDMQ